MGFPNLETEITKRKMTNKEIAERTGHTQSTMSKWRRRDHLIPFVDAVAIRDIFFPKFSLEYLFADEAEEDKQ